MQVVDILVDLVGIEPTTSSMPWNDHRGDLLTVKDLRVGAIGKIGSIVPKCYQFATKFLTERRLGLPVGEQPNIPFLNASWALLTVTQNPKTKPF